MAVSVSLSSWGKPAHGNPQRITCRNAMFLAIGLVVFEVWFIAGFGTTDMDGVIRRVTFQNVTQSIVSKVLTPMEGQKEHDEVLELNNTLPLSLRRICPVTRESTDAGFHVTHKFSQPMLLHVYMRHKAGVQNAMEMVLITTGVSMGTFERNFTAAGCMIDGDVYPVDTFAHDRATCTVPRGIEKGVGITMVIFKDAVVEEALLGPVRIAKEFDAVLEDGDLTPLKKSATLHGELLEHSHEDLLMIRSRVVYEGQLDPFETSEYSTIPRYEICLATQIKPSVHLLPDWIDYHRRIGVDFVYIYDNNAEKDVSKMLRHRHDVEVVYWPWEKGQIQSFTYSTYAMRARCEWLMLMDSDEYIMVGLGDKPLKGRSFPPLKAYMRDKRASGYAQVWFRWVNMKNSGYVQVPDKPAPEAYIHREDPQMHAKQTMMLGKTMVFMDTEWESSNAHAKKARGRAVTFNDWQAGMYPKRVLDTARIVHYRRRSWVEYRDKSKFGRANINNPMSVSRLKLWDRRGDEEFREDYMRNSLRKRKVYTHFRDMWRRATRELEVGESVTARVVGGRRCRTFYDLSRADFAEPVREKCEKVGVPKEGSS